MTMAVSKAVEEGATRGHLRLDRQHLGLGRRLRRPRRPDGRGGHPRGQDRRRQAGPGAGPRRAGAGPRRQLRRRPGGGARAGRAPPDRPGQLAQRVPHRRPAHRRPSRSATTLGDAPDVLCIPVGNAGQHQRLLAGLPGLPRGRALAQAAAPLRLPGRRAPRRWWTAPPVARPETVATAIRIGNPARGRAGHGRDARVGRRRGRGDRLPDPRGLPHARAPRRASSASRPRRPRWPGCIQRAEAGDLAPRARRWSACSPATA